MSRVIQITDYSATVIPLKTALQRSLDHADEVDLAGMFLDFGGRMRGCGEGIRQLALLGDQPSIFILADALADCRDAMNQICAYAVSRGIRLASSPAVVELPSDVERAD